MVSEEETRDETDGKEVQVEAADVGPVHFQMHQVGKLSSTTEIKSEAKILDSIGGILSTPEDQVLVEAPSDVKIPPEHNLNGTTSMNGDTSTEEDTSSDQMHKNNQKDEEPIEGLTEGRIPADTDESSKNNEAAASLSHRESLPEDISLLKHEKEELKEHDQQNLEGGVNMGDNLVQEDTLKSENAIEQTCGDHKGQNVESAKSIEDTQAASIVKNPEDEVLAERSAEVQVSLDHNMDVSKAPPDAANGNTKTDEQSKADDAAHLDHHDNNEEDKNIAEHTNKVVKVDVMEAGSVQQDMSKSELDGKPPIDIQEEVHNQEKDEEIHTVNVKTEEASHHSVTATIEKTEDTTVAEHTDEVVDVEDQQNIQADVMEAGTVHEDIPKSECDGEPTIDIQEVQNQEKDEETNDTVNAKTEEVSHHSVTATTEKTEDTAIAEHTDEVVEVEDQQNIQADVVEAGAVHEDIPKNECDGESTIDIQEVQNQDEAEEINDTVNVKTEEASHQSITDTIVKTEDTAIAEHTDAVVKVEDQQNIQADVMEAGTVHEDIPKSERDAESTIDIQEVQNQDEAEEINDTVNVKTEEASHQSITGTIVKTEYTTTAEHTDAVVKVEDQQNIQADVMEAGTMHEDIPKSERDAESTIDIQEVQNQEKDEETNNTMNVKTEEASHQSITATIDKTEDANIAEHTDEVVMVEDQQNIQADVVEAGTVQEDIPKSEHDGESTIDIQEVQNQEKDEETNDTVDVKTEEASHQSITATIDKTEDANIAEHTDDVVEVEDQQNIQADVMEAGMVHDDIPKSEHDGESTIDIQEVQNQDKDEETNDSVNVKPEEASHQSVTATIEKTAPEDNVETREPAFNQQVQNQESAEEIKDIEADQTEETNYQSNVATFAEAIPRDDVTTRTPQVQNLESEEEIISAGDVKTEETSKQSNVSIAEEATQENNVLASEPTIDIHPVQEVEPEQIKNTEAVDTEEVTPYQRHVEVFNDLVQEGNKETEWQVMDSAEVKDTEAMGTEAILSPSNVASHKELAIEVQVQESVEIKDIEATEPQGMSEESVLSTSEKPPTIDDNVTETEPTCDTEEIQNAESAEVIKNKAEVKAEEDSNQSNMAIAEEEAQENNVLANEPTIGIQPVQELQPEEIKNIEAVETEETTHQRHDTVFKDPAQEDNTTERESQVMESAARVTIEATETQTTLHQEISKEGTLSTSEEPTADDNVTTREPICGTQEIQNVESAEVTINNKEVKTEENSDQSNMVIAEEVAHENNVQANEPTIDVQPELELQPKEIKNIEDVETEETNHQRHEAVFEDPAQEHNTTARELQVMESAEEVDIKANETQPTLRQGISEESILCTSEEPITDDNVTARKTTCDSREIQNAETIINHAEVKSEDTSNHSHVAIAEEAAQDKDKLAGEPTTDIQSMQELEPEEIQKSESVETEQTSRNITLFKDPEQEDNTTSEMKVTESAEEMDDIEATETEAVPHQSSIASFDEPAAEDNVTASEPHVRIPQVLERELVEEIKDTEDTEPQGIHQQSIEELSPEDNVTASEPTPEDTTEAEPPIDNKQVQEPESVEEITDIEAVKTEETSDKSHVATFEELTPEGSVTVTEPTFDIQPVERLEAMEEPKDSEAINAEAISCHQNNATLEEPSKKDDMISSETQEIKSVEEMKNIEATETEAIPHQSNVAGIEELAAEYNVRTTDPPGGVQQVLERESIEELKDGKATEPQGVSEQTIVSTSEFTPEDNATARESSCDTLAVENVESEVKDNEDVKTEEFSNQSTIASSDKAAQESNELGNKTTSDPQQTQQMDSTEEIGGTGAVQSDDQQSNVATLEGPATEDNTTESEPNVNTQQVQEQESEVEIKEVGAIEADEISQKSNIATSEEANLGSSELASSKAFDVQQVRQLESAEETMDIQAAKAEETSGQDHIVNLNEPTPEDIVVTETEPPVDIKQAQELESVEEIKDIEVLETEETSNTSHVATFVELAPEDSTTRSEPTFNIKQMKSLEETEEITDIEVANTGDIYQQTDIAATEVASHKDDQTTIGPALDIQQGQNIEATGEIKDTEAVKSEEISNQRNNTTFKEAPQENDATESELASDFGISEATDIAGRESAGIDEKKHEDTTKPLLETPSIIQTKGDEETEELQPTKTQGASDDTILETPNESEDVNQDATASDLGENIIVTTHNNENTTEKDGEHVPAQSPGEDTVRTSSSIDQIKEEPKAEIVEYDSSQMSSDQGEEKVSHVQDKHISGELHIERRIAEAAQASLENDPQAAQNVDEKDDTKQSDEQTNDQHSEQLHDMVVQTQTCERSVDALEVGPSMQKVNLDQQQKEDGEIEKHKEELQTDEQYHDDKRTGFTTEPLVEPPSTETDTRNMTSIEVSDEIEAKPKEAVVTEMLDNEQTIHTPQKPFTSITDEKLDNVMKTNEGIEEDNEPKDADPLVANVENFNDDEQESTQKDAAIAEESTNEKNETTDVITNEEVKTVQKNTDNIGEQDPIKIEAEPGLASSIKESLQVISEAAPSNDQMLQNESYVVVSDDDKSDVHGEEKESISKIADDLHAIQESAEGIKEVEEKQETLSGHHGEINEDKSEKDVDKDSLDTNPEEKEASQMHSGEQCQDTINIIEVTENTPINAAATGSATFNEVTYDKAGGVDTALSDQGLKPYEDTGRNLDVSSIITASNGESTNEATEDHAAVLPGHPTQDETNTSEKIIGPKQIESELSFSGKPLPTEPAEIGEEKQTPREPEEQAIQVSEIDNSQSKAQKEVEQSDLPVSQFLMNLILGEESGNSEADSERKQEETTGENSHLTISKQEESVASLPTEDTVAEKLTLEQGKQDVKGTKETHNLVEEQSHDPMLDTEKSVQIDEELQKNNTHSSEEPAFQDAVQDKISSADQVTKMEARDVQMSDFQLDNKALDIIGQGNDDATTKIETRIVESNLNSSTDPKASEEDTLDKGRTGFMHETLQQLRSSVAGSEERMLSVTAPDISKEKDLPNDNDSTQVPPCIKQEEAIKSSNMEIKNLEVLEIQPEHEEAEKKEGEVETTGGVTEDQLENLQDSSQKSRSCEAISEKQTIEITEPVSSTTKDLAHDKETAARFICMDKKECSNLSDNGTSNFEAALESQPEGQNILRNQEKRDEAVDNRMMMENNLAEKAGEFNLHKCQETKTVEKSHEEAVEGDQQVLSIREPMSKEENLNETTKSQMQTEKNISTEEQEVSDSQVQEHDLEVDSPKEAPEAEESFVEVTKPELSTDEEGSPKADEAKITEEKISNEESKRDGEETKNFTDDGAVKSEARGAGQKSPHKKHNILFGVGSKVKHQLAKVKKAIIGKPGHQKSESPK